MLLEEGRWAAARKRKVSRHLGLFVLILQEAFVCHFMQQCQLKTQTLVKSLWSLAGDFFACCCCGVFLLWWEHWECKCGAFSKIKGQILFFSFMQSWAWFRQTQVLIENWECKACTKALKGFSKMLWKCWQRSSWGVLQPWGWYSWEKKEKLIGRSGIAGGNMKRKGKGTSRFFSSSHDPTRDNRCHHCLRGSGYVWGLWFPGESLWFTPAPSSWFPTTCKWVFFPSNTH